MSYSIAMSKTAISDQRGAAMAAYYDRSNDKTRVVAGSRRSLDDATLHGVSQGAAIGALGGMLGGHLQGRASPGSSGTAGSIVGGGLAGYLASRGPRGESRPDVHLRIDRGAGETSKLGSEVRSKTAFTLAELLVGGVGGATSGAATAGEGRRLAGAALGAPAGFVGSVFGGSGRSLPRSAVGSVAGGSLAGLAVRKRKKKQATKTAFTFADVVHHAGDAATMLSHGVHAVGSGVARAGQLVSENPDAVSHAAIGAGALKAKQAVGGAVGRVAAAVKNKLMKKKAYAMKQAALSKEQLQSMLARVKAGDPKMTALARKWSIAKSNARLVNPSVLSRRPFGEGISMSHGVKRIAEQASAMRSRVLAKTKGLSETGVSPSDVFTRFRTENPRQARRSQEITGRMARSSGLAAAKARLLEASP